MALTAEQLEIRALAREFAENEIAPHAEEWDAQARIPDDLFAKLAELGFLGMLVPESYGGLALDVPTYLLVLEELARADASVALAVARHNGPVVGAILAWGTDAQKEHWLPRLASGEILGAFALGEAGVGGDVAGLPLEASPHGDGWRLFGTEERVANGARADLLVAFARTGEDAVGCFLLEPGGEGWGEPRRILTMGHRAAETVALTLDGVSVTAEAVLGDPARGLAYAMETLPLARAAMASQAIGVAQASLDHAVRYALEREQFGRPLAAFDATQAKLGNMAARIAGARAVTLEVAARLDARDDVEPGLDAGAEALAVRAAGAKLLASETAMYAADEAVQIFGGYGYMRDYPVERLMRNAKGTELLEGASEVMREVISQEIIRAASDV